MFTNQIFRCTVTVGDKEESVSMWLEIIEKPNMPTGVIATLVNDTAPAKIRVSWSEGFDGNSPIIRLVNLIFFTYGTIGTPFK